MMVETENNSNAPRKVLISGCSSGFGLLAAGAFAARGDDVFAGVRSTSSTKDLEALVPEHRNNLTIVDLDVTSQPSVDRAVAGIIAAEGRIDILVNNAGVAVLAAVEDSDDDLSHELMETNFHGALRLTRAVLPHMRARGSGHIIMISSANGIVGMPFSGVYSASKFALEGMSEALASEIAGSGVDVCIVQPGAFHTAIDAKLFRPHASTAYPGIAAQVATMRNSLASATPSEVADAILQAAGDPAPALRVQVGADSKRLYHARREMDDATLATNLLAVLTNSVP